MPRTISDPIHRFFTYHAEEDISECNTCGVKRKGRHATNLKYHMAAKHQYKEDENVAYEYIVGSPKSTGSSDSAEESNSNCIKIKPAKVEPRDSRPSFTESRRTPLQGKIKAKKLIERLTEDKIKITALQKDLVQKDLEEKDLRLQLLRDEMEHKKEMYELEKQERLLKIQVLKANLKNQSTE